MKGIIYAKLSQWKSFLFLFPFLYQYLGCLPCSILKKGTLSEDIHAVTVQFREYKDILYLTENGLKQLKGRRKTPLSVVRVGSHIRVSSQRTKKEAFNEIRKRSIREALSFLFTLLFLTLITGFLVIFIRKIIASI